IVRGRVRPRLAGIQHLGRHAVYLVGDTETEDGVSVRLYIVEVAVERGMDDGARVFQLDPLADSVWTADPAGVDQPDVRFVLAQEVAKHLGVLGRMPHQKRRAKARAECWLRLL